METENTNTDPVAMLPKVFSGEASPEENKLVDQWISADPANREEYDSFARLWNLTARAAGSAEIDLDREWRLMESAMDPVRSRSITLAGIFRIAASVLLITSLVLAALHLTGTRTEKAPAKVLATVALPDGSVVTLNAGSKIMYKKSFGISNRDLELKGEAYFEVKQNAGLPFVVETGKTSVEVTGTKFNIKAFKQDTMVSVTVTDGAVRFFVKGQPARETTLYAGETGTYDPSANTMNKTGNENPNILSWKTRVMEFYNTPLVVVTEVLMNTYHVPLEIDPALRQCTITVSFENQELDAILDVLKSTLDLTITKKGKRFAITGKGC
jgi:transmembrane sensor